MGELELVARVDNRLLLRDETGVEYRLPICPKLKSAVYSAQATPQYATLTSQATVLTPAKGTMSVENPAPANVTKLSVVKGEMPDGELQPRLRPAELQIRLRAGDSPEQLAQFSDLTAEQISRFAWPIEAERADIIKAMRRTKLPANGASGAGSSAGGAATVGEFIMQHLGARGITSEQLTWNARRDIGAPWLIELKYEDGGRTHSARWTFDPARNHLIALDDEARWLSSPDTPVTDTIPISLHQAKRPTPVRGGRTSPVEFDLSDGPQVSGAPIPRTPRFAGKTASEETNGGRPDLRAVPDTAEIAAVSATGVEPGVAGIVPLNHWKSEKLDTVAVPIAEAVGESVAEPEIPTEPVAAVEASRSESPVAPSSVVPNSVAAKPKVSETMADALRPPTASRKNSRSKIPSWDKIVFGGKD